MFNANKPPLSQFDELVDVTPLVAGEISALVAQTSNHWRKIFNCFAKVAFGINNHSEKSWQDYREHCLLQQNSFQQLIFSPPDLQSLADPDHPDYAAIKVICGRGYFDSLLDTKINNQTEQLACGKGLTPKAVNGVNVIWQDHYFAVDQRCKLIVSPYFDYRQLTNARIEQLLKIIKQLGIAI